MRTFAQILHGKLHWKFQDVDRPDFASDIEIVEITGLTPEPQEGWCWDGEVFVAPPPITAPASVTMRQARLALLQSGLLAQVNTAIASLPGAAGDTARIEWEFSSTVERNRPLVQSLIGALGLTESQLDDLFRLAATL